MRFGPVKDAVLNELRPFRTFNVLSWGSVRAKETRAQVVVDFDGRAPPLRTARRNERGIVRLSAFGAAVMEKVVECSVVKHPALRS
jgi:hypothetical protein